MGVVVDEVSIGVGGVDYAAAEPVGLHGEHDAVVGRQDRRAVRSEDVERVVAPAAPVARRIERVGDPRGRDPGHGHHQLAGAQRALAGAAAVPGSEQPASS